MKASSKIQSSRELGYANPQKKPCHPLEVRHARISKALKRLARNTKEYVKNWSVPGGGE